MAAAEEQYRKSLVQFAAHLSDTEKKRLQFLYRLPSHYDQLPPETVLQALELLGVFSLSRPEGVAELPGWLGKKSLQKDIKKRLKKNKAVKLNDSFCLPLCDELYTSVDLHRCIAAVQRHTRALQAHLELLSQIVTTQTTGSIIYESVGGPGSLLEAAGKAERIRQILAEVDSSVYTNTTGHPTAVQHKLLNEIGASKTARSSEPMKRKVLAVSPSLQNEVAAAVTASFKPVSRSQSLTPEETPTSIETLRPGIPPPLHTMLIRASPPQPLHTTLIRASPPQPPPKPSETLPRNSPRTPLMPPSPTIKRPPMIPPKPGKKQPLSKQSNIHAGGYGHHKDSPLAGDDADSDNSSLDGYDEAQDWIIDAYKPHQIYRKT